MRKILLPELGEGINDVEIRDILINEGDSIEKNQSILILETDKASMEIPSDYSGVVSKIYVKSGDNISPNDHIIDIEDSKSFISNILKINDDGLKNSFWYDIIQACRKAKFEVDFNQWENRAGNAELGTTWLVNISIQYKVDNEDLVEFLSDCVNKEKVLAEYNSSLSP